MTENYENLATRVQAINRQIADIQRDGIVIESRQQSFEFHLGGDYKFLLTVLGLNAANSNFSCVFCLAPKTGRHLKSHKRRQTIRIRDPGVVRPNLLPAVPLDHVVIDTLHMHLRVTDKLFACVFDKIKYEKRDHFVSVVYKHVKTQGKLKAERDKIETSSLSATDRDKIIDVLISTDVLQVSCESQELGQQLKEIVTQYSVLRESMRTASHRSDIDESCSIFLEKFLAVFQTKMVTPYIHMMCVHVPELIERFGTLSAFCQQADEKLNHEVAAGYLRCSNFTDGARQVLQRQWRKTQY